MTKQGFSRYRIYLTKTADIYRLPLVQASTNLILSLLVIAFFGLVALKPSLTTVSRLTKELKEKQQVNRVLGDKINVLTQTQSNYAQVSQDLDFVQRCLPEKVEFEGLASRFNLLAVSHQLTLVNANFSGFDVVEEEQKQLPQEGQQTLTWKLSVAGSFANIKAFLADLEKMDRLTQVDSLTFSPSASIRGASLQIEISGRAFWYPGPVSQEQKS